MQFEVLLFVYHQYFDKSLDKENQMTKKSIVIEKYYNSKKDDKSYNLKKDTRRVI